MEKRVINTPRVLVSTVGAWSDSIGSNTMSSLFKEYDKTKLACLYIRADISDSNSCYHYFHIYEGRVMKSFIDRAITTGEEYFLGNHKYDLRASEREHRRYNFFKKHRSYFFLFIREFIWKFGKWKSKELNEFIDSFNPDVLVCPIESYIHFNRINEYIITRKKTKVIGFLWDDNFTYKQSPYNIGFLLHRFWLRRSVRRLVSKCSTIFALSPKMKEECDRFFNIDAQLLTKPIFDQPQYHEYNVDTPIRILYTGNLYVHRDLTIIKIVDAIKKINEKGEQLVFLDIYTSTRLSSKIANRITVAGCCQIHDPIKQTEVLQKQKEADILLFVESIDKKGAQDARLSFSTKITDYFSAGRCIWAVGNPELSAIDYLQRTQSALVSTDEGSIHSVLKRIVEDKSLIQSYARRGHNCGLINHNAELILDKLNKAIIDAL